jgi:hypothetical protein
MFGFFVWVVVASNLATAQTDAPQLQLVVSGQTKPPRRPPPSGVTLALNSLSDRQRARLTASLQALNEQAARRKNPFYVAFDETDERALAQKFLAESLPLFTAATALAAGRWESSDGDLVLRPTEHCPPRARCVPALAMDAADDLIGRIRFLAWPLGYAVVLRAPSPEQAAHAVDLLRADSLGDQIGLVLGAADLHGLRKSRGLPALVKAAARLSKEPELPFAGTLKDVAAAGRAGDELPWLKLPTTDVLIVPRLSTLATPERFVADVRTRLRDVQVDWLAQPR